MVDLRRQYDRWRASNLPPCPMCEQFPIEVPPGGVTTDEATEQPGSEQLQSMEPALDEREPELSATHLASIPSELADTSEPVGAAPGVVVLLLLIVAGVIAVATVYIVIRRSRADR